MVGRLNGFLDGRPLSLVAEDDTVSLIPEDFSTLLKLRRNWRSLVKPILVILEREQFRLVLQVGWLGNIEVFPRPKYLVRLFLP